MSGCTYAACIDLATGHVEAADLNCGERVLGSLESKLSTLDPGSSPSRAKLILHVLACAKDKREVGAWKNHL